MMSISTQDFDEYNFAMDLGHPEPNCSRRLYHWIPTDIMYGGNLTEEQRAFLIQIVKMKLPSVIQLMIKSFLVDLYRTSAPLNHIGLRRKVVDAYFLASFAWQRLHVSAGSAYHPLCRGYCISCGETAQTQPYAYRFTKFRLSTYKLTTMVLCYACYLFGYRAEEVAGRALIHGPEIIKAEIVKLAKSKIVFIK